MKILIPILLIMAAITPGVSQEPAPEDCQFSDIVQVDGREDEWPVKWLEEDEKKFFYNICTDEKNIYVRVKVKDGLTKRKLALFGLTLWMDPNGKKKKKLGLHFPTGAEAHEVMERFRATAGDNPHMSAGERADFQKQMDRSLIENLEMMELIGLADEPLTSTRSGITNGLKVALAQDEEGDYVYEAIIPFKAFRLSKASIASLGVGVETGKYTPPKVKPKAGTSTADPNAPGLTSGGGYANRFSASNMAVGQGYKSQGGNTPMSYSEGFWMTINLKK